MSRKRVTTIKHSSVREGDTIKVEGKYGDMDISRTGRVARITDMGNTWEYTTAEGYVILGVHRSGVTNPANATIELHGRNLDTPLFELDAG